MGGNRRGPRAARVAAGALPGLAASLLVAAVTACTSSSSTVSGASATATASPTAAAVAGGTARLALPAGQALTDIWPYLAPGQASADTAELIQLLYRPLYVFGDNGTSVTVNYTLSPAEAPTYSADGRTVTVTLKGWKWSDGEPVDASDVIFWLNMMRAEPDRFYGYAPGELPDNLASYTATSASTVVLHLKSPVSRIWFTYNQLGEITPMPAAWDVGRAGAKPGSGGCAADSAADHWARCAAVYRFLSAQAADTRSYTTNPLWGVVDGPWKLSSFRPAATGPVASFVPNPGYSGSPRPQLSRLSYYAYPDARAEYLALKAGRLDGGYVPPQYLAPVTGGQLLPASSPLGDRYTLGATYPFGIHYLMINFNSPTLGPAFRQLYLRQALQELIDQQGMVKVVDRGYGYPTSGGVPSHPASPWVPTLQGANYGQGPYPYSATSAGSLLVSHGWRAVGGVLTCVAPGAGATRCGAGVRAGTTLSVTLAYPRGSQSLAQEVRLARADMAQAGIRLTPVPELGGSLRAAAEPCLASQAACRWDLLGTSGWSFEGPGYEPAGGPLLATGAASNVGRYSDPETDRLIAATHTSNSLSVFQDYASYVARQLPLLWLPDTYTVTATSSKLANVGGSPLGTLLPEYWYFTK